MKSSLHFSRHALLGKSKFPTDVLIINIQVSLKQLVEISKIMMLIDFSDYDNFKYSIALQFPDDMLDKAAEVYIELSMRLQDRYFYVLGDTYV